MSSQKSWSVTTSIGWRRSPRNASVAIALMLVLVVLVGVSLTQLASQQVTSVRRANHRSEIDHFEQALKAVIDSEQGDQSLVRLPLNQEQNEWIEVEKLGNDNSKSEFRISLLRGDHTISTVVRNHFGR